MADAKEVQPMVMEKEKDDGSPMTMARPEWMDDSRPAVGDAVSTGTEPKPSSDPTIINQPDAQGHYPAAPGTPVTIDPDTGYPTGTTSVAELEANATLAKQNEKDAKAAAKAEKDDKSGPKTEGGSKP